DIHIRPLVVQAMTDFVEKYSRNSSNFYLVTCRTFSYRNDAAWKLTGWETHELALLSRPKIEYFVNAWYAELGSIERVRKDEYERKRKELLETLQPGDRRRLIDIAAFPLILTIMAVVHTHFGSLPDTRAEVYERCVELLLIRWQGERSVEGETRKQSILDALKVPPTVLYQALWEVAYKAHGDSQRNRRKGSEAALVTEDLLDGILKVYLKERDKVETFLEYCQSANGLLMLQGTISTPGKPSRKVYTFPHLTFEEYLAARHLADIDPDEYIYDLVGKSDRWHEAIKLLGEHLCFGSPQRPAMSALLDALSNPDVTRNVEERARMIWLAGDLLVLYQNAFPSKKAPSTERIFAQLKELAVTSLPDPRIRAECASLADELGYTLEGLHTFIPSPSPAAPAFQIARYPVTNGQYARFLDAEDFHEERYWVDFPAFAEREKKYKAMGNWSKKGYKWLRENLDERNKLLPRYWSDPRFGASRRNAPVVGISWYEANAYCRWLAAHVEQPEWAQLEAAGVQPGTIQFRLPTEAEWVQAAGGEEGGRFAWGKLENSEEEIVRYANTDESGIGRTTPVWMYPQGASQPHKVLDMSGNVWEWQANFRDDDHDVLALRGGSWNHDHLFARVANGYYNLPHDGRNYIGFRVPVFPLPQ
ncbi:MAG: SUMF1/EgtB/PvdO family nonheme iron enzyme, partial [Anaerolineaceae bacterium]|nr:SUMF1/EgtB/PvdO family nonheme iron enzyme [Anaerolineaceae bacterium]